MERKGIITHWMQLPPCPIQRRNETMTPTYRVTWTVYGNTKTIVMDGNLQEIITDIEGRFEGFEALEVVKISKE